MPTVPRFPYASIILPIIITAGIIIAAISLVTARAPFQVRESTKGQGDPPSFSTSLSSRFLDSAAGISRERERITRSYYEASTPYQGTGRPA